MIIMDYSQVSIAAISTQPDINNLTPDYIRHLILNSIRYNNSRFRDKYGELVIACDNGNVWRKQVFPQYKAHRAKNRKDSGIDWALIFDTMALVREELKEYFSYRVLQIPEAEADDIIGSLVHANGAVIGDGNGKILILSGDGDFKQLQHYSNVDQYNPTLKKYVLAVNAKDFLIEHIIRGDKGDGVPNILSDDNVFVEGRRQNSLFKNLYNGLFTDIKNGDIKPENIANFERNQRLIDLSKIPSDIVENVLKEYDAQANKTSKDLYQYFFKNQSSLINQIGDF